MCWFCMLPNFIGGQIKSGVTIDYVMERTAEFMGKSAEEVSTGTIYALLFKNTVVEVDIANTTLENSLL